jgi:hypothetical protein
VVLLGALRELLIKRSTCPIITTFLSVPTMACRKLVPPKCIAIAPGSHLQLDFQLKSLVHRTSSSGTARWRLAF